jgi:uncharacterized protein (DUF2235 family)
MEVRILGDKKKTKFNLLIVNYLWLEDQAKERGISMNAVMNELITEQRGQKGVKKGSKLVTSDRVQ